MTTKDDSRELKTTKDHKRGTVRDAPRPGRAGGAVIAVSPRGYRGEPRRCLRQRHHRCHFEGDLAKTRPTFFPKSKIPKTQVLFYIQNWT